MSQSTIDKKLKGLEERFENEMRNLRETPFANQGGLGPRTGSGRKPNKPLFTKNEIPAYPPRTPHTTETENSMKEVYKLSGKLNLNGVDYESKIEDLQQLGELGSGTCGFVVKMLHKPSAAVIAVKQMRRSGNSEETKRILMDFFVVIRSHDCPYIVRCFGCFVTDADVWICMEMMASCFDKLLKRLGGPIPEHILGKVTVATVNALSYLKDKHGVIHRDVKPSNILLDERGNIKLCDFGISGRLVDSKAETRSAGCAAYLAPERIDPPDPSRPDYDIRADVWSLGISLVELATGVFPYRNCQNDFEVLAKVIGEDPPKLPEDGPFSPEFKSFVTQCLTKNYRNRPKYGKLLEHPFVVRSTRSLVSVADWYANLPLAGQSNGSPSTTATYRTEAVHNVGEASNGRAESPVNYVTSAQQWINQVTPLFQRKERPSWTRPINPGGSSSQPASLESDYALSPYPARRNLDNDMTPPLLPARRVSVDSRLRPSPASSGNTSPIVFQRFQHQIQQRKSRADGANRTPRHRSLSRDHSAGRSPEPPPRTCRPHPMLGHSGLAANGSNDPEPPPLHERLHPHPPSPLLFNNRCHMSGRLTEGRSQSLTRSELRNGFRTEFRPEPPPPPPKHQHDDQSWLHSLAGLVKRRLGGYVRAQLHAARQAHRWGNGESWSVPASPLPPRGHPPRPAD